MTTKVTVDAHAGWPVEVTTTDTYAGHEPQVSKEIVEAGQRKDFHLSSARSISFKELPSGYESVSAP